MLALEVCRGATSGTRYTGDTDFSTQKTCKQNESRSRNTRRFVNMPMHNAQGHPQEDQRNEEFKCAVSFDAELE